ncbi:MAG: trigger factor, partial [Oscillospiraceae bacterium]|nr:trigger factor [Oscillospiraceae bacterium]
MNVKNIEKLEKSRVAVDIEVSAEEFESAVAKAYLKTRNKINVPGFRTGKAPRKMIEKLYGAEIFYNDAVDIALPEAYTQAIGDSALDVIGYPEIELGEVSKDGFTFKATVPVYPEVKLGQYKGLSAVKNDVKVTANDIKERLNEMAQRNSRLVSVDRKAKKGDIAVIDFEGFENGTAFDGGKGENYELELGSGSFVPGFEDQVIGMKAGEEKDIDITFPEDYHKDLAGKAVVFHVKVNEVKFKEVPALDDDFAKDVSEFDTLKELKDDIKKQITDER